MDTCIYYIWYRRNFDDKKEMIITSKIKNYDRDLIQITEVSITFEENSDYQFDKYQIIFFVFLVSLFIICNIILICLLRV